MLALGREDIGIDAFPLDTLLMISVIEPTTHSPPKKYVDMVLNERKYKKLGSGEVACAMTEDRPLSEAQSGETTTTEARIQIRLFGYRRGNMWGLCLGGRREGEWDGKGIKRRKEVELI